MTHRLIAVIGAWSLMASAVACGQPTDRDHVGKPETDSREVTPDTTFYQEVSWSPDGSRLSFSRLDIDLGYRSSIGVAGADGSGYVELAGDTGDRWTSWSPNGSQIAFASSRNGNQDIYVIDVDGVDIVRLTSSPSDETHPDWSPDGSRILFVSDRDSRSEIYVMDADGQNQRRVSRTVEEDWNPRWSPDGKRIAYYGTASTGEDSVYVMLADGSGKRTLAPGIWPSWSPDGSSLLYSFDHNIYSISFDTLVPIRVIEGGYFARWSPDASQMAFIRSTWRAPGGWPSTSDVFVRQADDHDEINVTGGQDTRQ